MTRKSIGPAIESLTLAAHRVSIPSTCRPFVTVDFLAREVSVRPVPNGRRCFFSTWAAKKATHFDPGYLGKSRFNTRRGKCFCRGPGQVPYLLEPPPNQGPKKEV